MPERRGAPQWSLHKVLQYVNFELVDQLRERHYLQRALFLLALATGCRASQITALTRHLAFTMINSCGKAVTLAPSPTFLAKNDQADNLIGLLRVPAFMEDGSAHSLCPVHVLRNYMTCTAGFVRTTWSTTPGPANPLHQGRWHACCAG